MLLRTGATEIGYEVYGETGPWVTFSHSLGCNREMWAEQRNLLADGYRVLTYDLRGHGESTAFDEDGSLELFADDLKHLLDELGVTSSHFVGVSIGAMIGQTMALKYPERIASLTLANSSSRTRDEALPAWRSRIDQAREMGIGSLAMPSLQRWFPDEFVRAHSELVEALARTFSETSRNGFIACSKAIMGLNTTGELHRISVPTLIIAGTEFQGATVDDAREMSERIDGATLAVIEGAGHLSNIDHATPFNQFLLKFLDEVSSQD